MSTRITAGSESLTQAWLVDGSTGQGAWLEEGSSVRAAISPDARAVVGSRYDGTAVSLDRFDLATGQKSSLGAGYDGIWLQP